MKKFEPIGIPEGCESGTRKLNDNSYQCTVSTTIKGDAAREFEKMVEDNNINKSLLLRQMIFHCLGREDLLDALKKHMLLWGTKNGKSE